MKLSVPYYSQFVDVSDPFWMLRACGAVCFKEVVEFYGVVVPDIVSLCQEAREKGGYDMSNGWGHDYLVQKARELGLDAVRKEGLESVGDITEALDLGSPVIISVEKRVLEQTRFHMIVVVGYEKGEALDGASDDTTRFYYHESESTDKNKGAYRVCDKQTLLSYWRGKAIFIRKG